MRKPTQESALKRLLRTPQFRMKVCRDKTKYQRHAKHRNANPSMVGSFLLVIAMQKSNVPLTLCRSKMLLHPWHRVGYRAAQQPIF